MKRGKPLKRVPFKRSGASDYQREYDLTVQLVKARSGGFCEILAAHDCDHLATGQPHHRKLRSQGGSNSLVNLIDVCFTGHNWIHRELPREKAEALQLIIPRDVPEYAYKMRV